MNQKICGNVKIPLICEVTASQECVSALSLLTINNHMHNDNTNIITYFDNFITTTITIRILQIIDNDSL